MPTPYLVILSIATALLVISAGAAWEYRHAWLPWLAALFDRYVDIVRIPRSPDELAGRVAADHYVEGDDDSRDPSDGPGNPHSYALPGPWEASFPTAGERLELTRNELIILLANIDIIDPDTNQGKMLAEDRIAKCAGMRAIDCAALIKQARQLPIPDRYKFVQVAPGRFIREISESPN